MRAQASPLIHLCLALLLGAGSTRGADPNPKNAEPVALHHAALQALRDGLPEVAAAKATRLLKQAPPTERQTLASIAVESWIRARKGDRALEVLARESVPNSDFWRAQALALSGKTDEARQRLQERIAQQRATHQERLLLAQILLAQGEAQNATATLSPLLAQPTNPAANLARELHNEALLLQGQVGAMTDIDEALISPRGRYLQARAMIERGQHDQARAPLQALADSHAGGPALQQATHLLLAELDLQDQRIEAAGMRLCALIDKGPVTKQWPQIFRSLQTIALTSQSQTLASLFAEWIVGQPVGDSAAKALTSDELATRQAYGLILTAHWLGSQKRYGEALGLAETLLALQSRSTLATHAMGLAAQWYDQENQAERCLHWLDELQDRHPADRSGAAVKPPEAFDADMTFALAQVAAHQGRLPQARLLFERTAHESDLAQTRLAALHNAGLCALNSEDPQDGLKTLVALEKEGGRAAAAALEIDRALNLASQPQANAKAISELQRILGQNQDPATQQLLRLTLAECLLASSPPDHVRARKLLDEVTPSIAPEAGELRRRLNLDRLRCLDAAGELKELCLQGESMIKQSSEQDAAFIAIKVAEAQYRLGDYAAARRSFEAVATNHPSSPHADTALYYAGLSAMAMLNDESRDAAIAHWQQLVEGKGPLSFAARMQQMEALRQFGQEDAALQLIGTVLEDPVLPKEKRWRLLCEKAELEILVAQKKSAPPQAAIGTLSLLLREAGIPLQWRARAGFTLAGALQQAARTEEAIEACYDVISSSEFSRGANPDEYHWYYRAGFLGMELLEQARRWEEAARLGEKLALSNGSRSAEARERATKIRLQHFLWDGR